MGLNNRKVTVQMALYNAMKRLGIKVEEVKGLPYGIRLQLYRQIHIEKSLLEKEYEDAQKRIIAAKLSSLSLMEKTDPLRIVRWEDCIWQPK